MHGIAKILSFFMNAMRQWGLRFLRLHALFFDVVALLWCSSLLLFALSLQMIQHLNPCPLCLVQRGFYLLLVVCYVVGLAYNRRNMHLGFLCRSIVILVSLIGLITAGRHEWLQHQPVDPFSSCTSQLGHLFNVLPWHEAIIKLLEGGGDCHQVTWQWLGLSLPAWSFVGFSIVLLLNVLAVVALVRHKKT